MNDKFKKIAFFIAMSVLWSVVFVTALHSWAGVGIDICLGISLTGLGKHASKKKRILIISRMKMKKTGFHKEMKEGR